MKAFPRYIGIFLIILSLIQVQSCKDQVEVVPYVPVRFEIELDYANELTTPGFSRIFEYDGYGGVIVFCEFYDPVTPSASVYYAYDAACTLEVSEDCSVNNEGNSVNVVCPCCDSEYSLFGGYPISGEASLPLKQYNVSVMGSILRVYN